MVAGMTGTFASETKIYGSPVRVLEMVWGSISEWGLGLVGGGHAESATGVARCRSAAGPLGAMGGGLEGPSTAFGRGPVGTDGVAVAEGVLFILWQTRSDGKKKGRANSRDKKIEPLEVSDLSTNPEEPEARGLRRRLGGGPADD